MGVLIVIGTVTLGVLIARRAAPLARVGPAASNPFSTVLDEPAGTRITQVIPIQDRLALHLQGGGPDRVTLIDPRTGGRSGTILLAR